MVPVFVQAGGDDWRGKPERFGYEERGYEPRSGDASSLAPHIGDKEMMTESEGMQVEKALVQKGYDPGPADGASTTTPELRFRNFRTITN
jgi:hypothetical protein